MAVKYVDRVFVSVNGVQLVDVQSASLKQNRNARAVASMTPDRFNRGFVQGNTEIDIALTQAIRNLTPRVKLDQIDYELNDVQIGWVCGQELFIASGVFLKDAEDASGGVGDEAKVTTNLGALRLTDAVGNPTDFNLELAG
jgi:hypothetical protein